ncbi:YndJ family transporter [Virgibacillus necropolis]|uniref:YndJ-like protein n=1 Tax=Virgibacillus necropolis TaxID=163877 RepID=A0A221MEA6_9BACI|nr:YndJ family transporter [Virgibacillus necropolis]ASN06008.1 hypothetical protein CFK40_13770 [Virgibacillus necropolis]
MIFFKLAFINVFFLIIIALFNTNSWYFIILTIAQLFYIPLTLYMVSKSDQSWFARFLPYVSIPASLAVILLQLTTNTPFDLVFALLYFVFTLTVAGYGLSRFLKRGFTHMEEFMIDMGLIYLAIGGAWFLVSEAKIDTDFSPILTWLTSVHFHYSSFLLPIFVGFLGRLYKSTFYKWVGTIILLSPIVVAVGIAYSPLIELFSVLMYIVGIYGLIILSVKASVQHVLQKWMIRISFAALGISIVFSLLYAFGNLSKLYVVTIDFMLRFHGVTNCVLFALIGIIGWYIQIPPSKQRKLDFPISMIRGKWTIGKNILSGKLDNKKYNGLIDDMGLYKRHLNRQTLSPAVIDFYENTIEYRLFAEVKWCLWFKPFAGIYRLISRYMKQINLPLSSQKVEMTGDIFSIKEEVDGRSNPRAWVRMANEETIFVALYSYHQTLDRTYMNIALPLPRSSMIGILEMSNSGKELVLTSKKQSSETDSGIYLAVKKSLFKLPIEETFQVQEDKSGNLKAQHNMWIFSIPFLTINYAIYHKDVCN